MSWVYYDESGQYDESGHLLNMTVGALMAPLNRWDAFEKAWLETLGKEGLDQFHMTDFEAWKGPYDFRLSSGDRDRAKHDRIINGLLKTMLDHCDGFAGFSSTSRQVNKKRQHKQFLEDGVAYAAKHAIHEVWDFYKEPINLVFAKQDHLKPSIIRKYIALYDYGEGKGRVKSISFSSPSKIGALQAADIIAYEMSRIRREGKPERYPFKKLREGAIKRGIKMTLTMGPTKYSRFNYTENMEEGLSAI